MIYFLFLMSVCFADDKFSTFPEIAKPKQGDCIQSYPISIGKEVPFCIENNTAKCNGVLLPTNTAKSFLYLKNWCKDLHVENVFDKNKIQKLEYELQLEKANSLKSTIQWSLLSFSAGFLLYSIVDFATPN